MTFNRLAETESLFGRLKPFIAMFEKETMREHPQGCSAAIVTLVTTAGDEHVTVTIPGGRRFILNARVKVNSSRGHGLHGDRHEHREVVVDIHEIRQNVPVYRGVASEAPVLVETTDGQEGYLMVMKNIICGLDQDNLSEKAVDEHAKSFRRNGLAIVG